MTGPPWWDRGRHADRRPLLMARGRIRDAVRRYFEEQAFVEVECGALQISPGNEAHLHAFSTERIGPDGRTSRLFLHTSPEFACKKLLAAGERRIFTLAPVYRNRELGSLHAPEFAMLEWYRAEEHYDAVIGDCLNIVRLAAIAAHSDQFRFRGRTANPFAAFERITVGEAFRHYAKVDLLSTLGPDGATDTEAFARAATAAGINTAPNDSWSDIFSRVLTERVEPELGLGRPTILDRYPRAEAALARAAPDDPKVSQRFELYMCGVELANGFGELTDAVEQQRRFESEMAEKERVYGERYPIDEDFLAALARMPEASGAALGFDRLAMLATGADRIERVMWTPPCQ
jgi:elongation factor P--(R)-beta-lysine ligase